MKTYTVFYNFVAILLALVLVGCAAVNAPKPWQVGSTSLITKAPALPLNYVPPADGQVRALFNGTTWRLIQDCIGATPFSRILRSGINPNGYMFAKPLMTNGTSYGWAFVSVDAKTLQTLDGIIGLEGNMVNAKTMEGVMSHLKSKGWSDVKPADVPQVFKQVKAPSVNLSSGTMLMLWLFEDAIVEVYLEFIKQFKEDRTVITWAISSG